MPCHMCEWVCCLLCFRRTHVPTTRSCLNIHTAVFVIPNYLPMESCCHTSKTRVTCGIRVAIFSWWSGSNFMSSVLLVSIFKRGYSEKQKKRFLQKQMSDAHSWQRMLKTQSVLGIVTSRFRLFKNKGINSPVHQVLSSTLCSIPALTLFSSFNYVSNPGADDQQCRHSKVHLWADWRQTSEFCKTLGCEENFALYFVCLFRCCVKFSTWAQILMTRANILLLWNPIRGSWIPEEETIMQLLQYSLS